ncbi:polysaccharide biosynthesis/export family protein [Pirellulales bacterium]|nr:polysaccharide biosynthesis/export family protein [Pirellulales bacterium]
MLLLITACSSGCANRIIKARHMPDRYQAAKVTNAQVADLSRLSMSTTSSSLIEPEDVVDVTISSGLEEAGRITPTPVRVGDTGIATIALIGQVPLAGLEPFQAEQRIATAAIERGLFKAPQVTVTMRKKAINRITVVGAVKEQGTIELPKGQSTLLAALMAAGSLDEKAGTEIEIRRHEHTAATQLSESGSTADTLDTNSEDIQLTSAVEQSDVKQAGLIRPRQLPRSQQSSNRPSAQPRTMKIDLATIDGTSDTDIGLQDGDVVRVETRDPHPISVIGLVQKPGQYEMPVGQPVHVLDAIAMAGERSNPWADKIYITRHVTSENEPIVIETSVVNAQHSDESNIRLSPGDVVSVEQTPQTVIHNVFSTIFRFSIVAGQSIPIF